MTKRHEHIYQDGHRYRVLDEESMKDPETLLLLFNDMLSTERQLITVTGMMAALLLHSLDEFEAPPGEIYEDTVELLKEWFMSVQQYAQDGRVADQVRDLLESKE